VTKMLDRTPHPDSCDCRRPHVVARPVTEARDSAGFGRGMRGWPSDAQVNRSDAPLVLKMTAIGFLNALGRYRDRVDVEIGKASERGARWWSRRLVQLYEEAGLVVLDK
jgi:hypothetical protein